jgi:hypothetical protein
MLTRIRIGRALGRTLAGRRGYCFGDIQEFTPEELKKSEKYVEETLRNRNWVTYMLASYFPQALRPTFYALHLLDLELTKISENAREPALGTPLPTQRSANSTSGKTVSSRSTTARNPSPSPFRSLCTTPSTTTP